MGIAIDDKGLNCLISTRSATKAKAAGKVRGGRDMYVILVWGDECETAFCGVQNWKRIELTITK